jgi:capsular exopolysaccharide synthesis family protein
MTYRDDEASQVPESNQAMVGTSYPTNGALVAASNGAPAHVPMVAAPNFAAHAVMRGGMDANTFLHALRRRWLLALCMGTVAATLAAIALWILFPESSSAVSLFQVYSEPRSLLSEATYNDSRKFDILCKTQLALLKSYFVLQAAVRDPSIASLSMFAGEPDPVQWLQDHLRVEFPQQSEILSIALSGDDPPEEQRLVVDAVAKAYENEVIYAGRQKRLAVRDALARSLGKLNKELNDKLNDYFNIAKELGVSQEGVRDPETDLLLSEISNAHKQKSDLEHRIIEMRTEYAVQKRQLEDPALIEAQVDEMLEQDPQMAILQQELMNHQIRLAQLTPNLKHGGGRSARGIQRQIEQIQNQIAEYRGQMTQQLMGQQASAPNAYLQSMTQEFQVRLASMQQQWGGVNAAIEEKMKALAAKNEQSVDLQTRSAELEQLQEIAKDMSLKLETLDVEADAPEQTEQIQKLQPAIVTLGINKVQHYSIAALGGLGAFALTCFGIAFLEFHKRRLNEPKEVDEGLGIRVVGTLPAVAARRSGDPSSLVAQVTASIDSVRTLLMHDSTSKRRQIVLVTSADASEGRTTVASQLAASLARAGRRTLLIDGDLRRPKLHELFDVSLEEGLCEVLRAEVDVADVIRPTHSEGLWLLTAGYCDRDAIQALATEQMQPIFDKLRGEYDFIIIDGAPVLGISDALIFGQYSDGAILSVRRDHSQMPKIYQATELLRGVGIRVIGAVVNGVPTKTDDRITQLQLITSKAEQSVEAAS